ncbi:MAG: 3-phosphoshikimate 1-carboxyvinyltransferase [Candidatus Bathyarchaeota archaeon]
MDIVIGKTESISGSVSAPPSKAYTHRMLIASSLSNGVSKVLNPLVSEDTQATLRAVNAFGVKTEINENYWTIYGQESVTTPSDVVDCRESGSTLRFMIPVAALASGPSSFLFGASFENRPITPLLRSLQDLGAESTVNKNSVSVCGGGINGGRTSIRGDISSQFISGLLFACPKAKKDTEISISTPLESKGYVEMTLEVLVEHGLEGSINPNLSKLWIPSNQNYSPCDHVVPGDFSSAAFLFAAAAITSSKITVKNLNYNTSQGDIAILEILGDMGGLITVGNDFITFEGNQLSAVDIDAKDIPDLVPICAVLACYAHGTTEIFHAHRLRYKESDRLDSMYRELKKMGANITQKEDGLIITGSSDLHGTIIDSHNDHRIAMACAVAALGVKGKTKIQNVECINKSYPNFFNDMKVLGVNLIGS